MSTYSKDPRIDDYIDKLPDWQQAICQKVRDTAHDADPELAETIKRTILPYFVLDGNVCALLAAKTRVNIFIYDPVAPDPTGLINQGQGNKTARAIQVYENDEIDWKALKKLLQAVIANNRAGGWRAIQK
jgi:hypothetical protein